MMELTLADRVAAEILPHERLLDALMFSNAAAMMEIDGRWVVFDYFGCGFYFYRGYSE